MLTSFALCIFCIIFCEARLTSKQTDSTANPSDVSHLVRVTRTPENTTLAARGLSKGLKTPKNDTVPKQVKKANMAKKKPVQKFNDFEYDEDFQSKFPKTKAADSNEYEDEDFSLGDYEFDIHHDEFLGVRSRPLEPRLRPDAKSKTIQNSKSNPVRPHKSSSKTSQKESSTGTDDSSEGEKDKKSNSKTRSRRSIDEYYDDARIFGKSQLRESSGDKSYTVRILNGLDSHFARPPYYIVTFKNADNGDNK